MRGNTSMSTQEVTKRNTDWRKRKNDISLDYFWFPLNLKKITSKNFNIKLAKQNYAI